MGGIAAKLTPPLAAHGCEIPAYAGMVPGGTEGSGCILALLGGDWAARACCKILYGGVGGFHIIYMNYFLGGFYDG